MDTNSIARKGRAFTMKIKKTWKLGLGITLVLLMMNCSNSGGGVNSIRTCSANCASQQSVCLLLAGQNANQNPLQTFSTCTGLLNACELTCATQYRSSRSNNRSHSTYRRSNSRPSYSSSKSGSSSSSSSSTGSR